MTEERVKWLEGQLDLREKQLIECQHQLITRNAELACARSETGRVDWAHFEAAYKKACESSQPEDWMDAALYAQQAKRAAETTPSAIRTITAEEYKDARDTFCGMGDLTLDVGTKLFDILLKRLRLDHE